MIQVLLLGCNNTGKTYFLRKYIDKQQNPNSLGTVGLDFKHHCLQYSLRKININFWDSSGQQRYQQTMSHIIRRTASFIIFFDVTDHHSVEHIPKFLSLIKTHCPNAQKANILILGNKLDIQSPGNEHTLQTVRQAYLNVPGIDVADVSCKYNFDKAKEIVQDFLMKSYEEEYYCVKVPKALGFLKELKLQQENTMWFEKEEERKKISKALRQNMGKKSNQNEIMIISLIFEVLQLFHDIYQKQRAQLQKIQQSYKHDLQHQSSLLQTQIADIIHKHEEQVRRIRQQVIQYEYYIVEADQLHCGLSQSIANSPFKDKFAEFRRVAERANEAFEEDLMWQKDIRQRSLLGSQILAGDLQRGDRRSIGNNPQRLIFEEKIQKLQQIIEDLLPSWNSGSL